ncbi:NAD(P)/FAD-dependent oxidoreductase [Tomitella fengzijianii]|uniref:FAD-binding oxidoreductase n=1 Tax=Tomitella fengzijianii TaxID=2597660 RepID=A0A516WZ75_9ACTN|nr:FAD-dependent oxidoreductase [Tomitella fengzijianii]QDQ96047.1 FAD-binding oxidoreductase [Tomitella fengzijianii]
MTSHRTRLNRSDYERGDVPIRSVGWAPETLPPPMAPLTGDTEASVVIVGAGLAGSSTALHLAERGIDVAVVEAAQPGDGASGRNAGHVQPYLATLDPTEDWPDKGQRLLDTVIEGRGIVYELADKHGIACDAQATGMVEGAIRRYGELEEKARVWRGYGYDVDVVGKADLTRLLGTTEYSYGLHWGEGGSVNPYLFTRGLADAAVNAGARVYGDSPVISVEQENGRRRVRTLHGSVLADQVVLCTNGHAGNQFYPDLAKTQYPLVAYAMATTPLPDDVLAAVNPSRAAFTQFPAGLVPMVIDERNRLITASIPRPRGADKAETYFRHTLDFLHRTFPVTRDADIGLESYWTGMTASSSSVYHADYPQIFRVDDGVLALMNLGTWGVFLGPLLGRNLANALADDRMSDVVLPITEPETARYRNSFNFKIRYVLIPGARVVDRFNIL